MEQIYTLLHRLGISATYTGFYPAAEAVRLCMQRQDRLQLVTRRLYPVLAKQYGTNWQAMERNLRTVSKAAWRKNRPLLEELAGLPLPKPPSAGYFLALLSGHLLAMQKREEETATAE